MYKFVLWSYVIFIVIIALFLAIPVAVFCFLYSMYSDNFNLFNTWTDFWWNLLEKPVALLNKKDGF